MQSFLATSLVIGGFISIIATIPQAVKLIQIKRSNELSLPSWIIWLGYQMVSVAYSYSIGAYLYVAINLAWGVFYAIMVVLIIRYRDDESGQRQESTQEASYNS